MWLHSISGEEILKPPKKADFDQVTLVKLTIVCSTYNRAFKLIHCYIVDDT
jgi:hypothetical protein